jgi:hypothetical protein
MKKHTIILTEILSFLLVFGFVFSGCDILNNGKTDSDIAIVVIKLPTWEARSVYTDELISQTTAYHLLVTKGGAEVYNNTFPASQSSIKIELTPGSHIFTLNAMKDSEILGTGSTTITLVKGDNTVDIVLVPAKGQETNDGTYAHITVTWEDNEEEFDGVSSGLNWLASNAVEGGNYTITAYADESISLMTLSYNGKNVTITLTGDESSRNISLLEVGAMFTVNAGVTLVLEENIILTGRNDNTDSLVCVGDRDNVVMNDGAEIRGNTSSSQGGGVFIYGSFTMNGGKIINNITNSYYGGGICSYGIFTMNGGTIIGNTATNNYGESYVTNGGGGGVFTAGGHFLMTGGTITGNTSAWGSGVLIFSGKRGHPRDISKNGRYNIWI